LLAAIARNLLSGIDWIQIREKDLGARELFELVRQALALPNPRGVKILVNGRVDVALAAGAAGAHLPADSPAPGTWRELVPPEFLLGVSCHSLEEVLRAAEEGAGYVVFGPVFDPLSKAAAGPAQGLAELERAARAVPMPVLALGGITAGNLESCIAAGAAGVAGISLYQSPCILNQASCINE
jgi:thiamine-phosphate pyrophosphorylase